MKLISVVTPCYNESDNINEIYQQVKKVFSALNYRYEHIFIDNASTDGTDRIIARLAKQDKNIKLISNARNFGYVRSQFYGLLQAKGDAVVMIAADLQDPVALIPKFIKKWEEGYKVVAGIKHHSDENKLMFALRNGYYSLITKISDIKLIKYFIGFGLYDQEVIAILRKINDPYPYLRGLISEIGYEVAEISYVQPIRKRGISKISYYTLYDLAMLGITSHTKIPIRLATVIGFTLSLITFFIGIIVVLLKMIFWQKFSLGAMPVVLGLFFFSSMQLFFIGLLGEYVTAIHTQVLRRPLVIEKKRINFENLKHTTHRKPVNRRIFKKKVS